MTLLVGLVHMASFGPSLQAVEVVKQIIIILLHH